MPKPKKPVVPPVAPKPTYGAGGKPFKAPKVRPDLGLPTSVPEGSRLGRLLKFRKGGFMKRGN